jgi:hypothetical protein
MKWSHPSCASFFPFRRRASDDLDDGEASSRDPLRQPLEPPGMHGQARGAGIAPAVAAGTTRAPPRPRRGSLAYASRLRATRKQTGRNRNRSEAPEKGRRGAEGTCDHHKANKTALAPLFFGFCLTILLTQHAIRIEKPKRGMGEGVLTRRRVGQRRRGGRGERDVGRGGGKQRSSAVGGTGR